MSLLPPFKTLGTPLDIEQEAALQQFFHALQAWIDYPTYANNAAALAGGLVVGDHYRTGGDPDVICVVH